MRKDGPSPNSASERRLERIHNDETQGFDRLEELRQKEIDLERKMALDIAFHPAIEYSRSEVLELCQYDSDRLITAFKELYSGCN